MVIVRTFLKVLLGHPNEMIWDHQKDCSDKKKKCVICDLLLG